MENVGHDPDLNSLGRVAVHLLALLVAPTVGALLPWFVDASAVRGSLPVLSATVAAGYAVWARRPRYGLPLLPFGVVAVLYLVAELTLALGHPDELDPTLGWYGDAPYVVLVCWVVQPVLALAGGWIATGIPRVTPGRGGPPESGPPRYW